MTAEPALPLGRDEPAIRPPAARHSRATGRRLASQWFANLHATFEEFEASIEELRDLGDVVLGLGHAHLRFRSGVILDTEAGYLTRFRDALAVWARMYPSHAEALEAVGLRE